MYDKNRIESHVWRLWSPGLTIRLFTTNFTNPILRAGMKSAAPAVLPMH